jgi:hypothetical protein
MHTHPRCSHHDSAIPREESYPRTGVLPRPQPLIRHQWTGRGFGPKFHSSYTHTISTNTRCVIDWYIHGFGKYRALQCDARGKKKPTPVY